MSKKWSASDRTRTYTYIFPMLGGNYQEFKYVINAYLYDSNNALQDKIFILLYRDTKNIEESKDFIRREQIIKIDPNFYSMYDLTDNYKMYCFNIPLKWKPAYYLFKQGKYSKFPDIYKRHLLRFHNLTMKSEVGKVLYRAEEQYEKWEKILKTQINRKQEIGDMPDIINRETFDRSMLFTESGFWT